MSKQDNKHILQIIYNSIKKFNSTEENNNLFNYKCNIKNSDITNGYDIIFSNRLESISKKLQ